MFSTKQWSPIHGASSFSWIQKGTLRDGRKVAVKRFRINSSPFKESYENEICLLAKLQHINIVKLLGCCATKGESFLVYEFMPNGSLYDHIHGKREVVLPWPIRFQIVEGIAQGLLYLHKQCGLRIIHLDMKLGNILLDDGYIPKIGDFGISLMLPQFAEEGEALIIRGTCGYMAPEWVSDARFSVKTDVYSYGVLLLETISGKKCNQANNDFNTLFAWVWHLWKARKLAEFIDSRLGGVADVSQTKEIKRCIHIALLCVEHDPARRPTMYDVLRMLSDKKLKLPIPQQPAFTNEHSSDNEQSD